MNEMSSNSSGHQMPISSKHLFWRYLRTCEYGPHHLANVDDSLRMEGYSSHYTDDLIASSLRFSAFFFSSQMPKVFSVLHIQLQL